MTAGPPPEPPGRTVGWVADELGVTVRTLHHYDEIGLVVPAGRSAAGYRLYTPGDLERLRAVVVYRRLGFPLAEVAALVEGEADPVVHLRRQRAAVAERIEGLRDLVSAIDSALESTMADREVTDEDMRALFGDGFAEAQAEAEERWGDTEAWAESRRRTARYTVDDWAEVREESDALHAAFAAAMDAGEPPTSEAAMDAAEAHRRHVDGRFYPLSHEGHRGLADLYVSDPRFTATYDEIRPGMARYVHEAIHANADRHGD